MVLESVLPRRSFFQLAAGVLIAAPTLLKAAAPERSLSFYNLHTSESLKTVYWADGDYLPDGLAAINHNLRDYRTGEVREIDRRLLDLLHQLHGQLETNQPFQLISGYRSPATNAMLHEHSDGVAQHSLHMEGMAADIRVEGRTLEQIRKTALAMKLGGVGYYPSQFVHVDVGRVRFW